MLAQRNRALAPVLGRRARCLFGLLGERYTRPEGRATLRHATRPSKGRSSTGLSAAGVHDECLAASIGGRAPLQRRVKVWVDVEERPFRAASEAREKGTESCRDGRNAARVETKPINSIATRLKRAQGLGTRHDGRFFFAAANAALEGPLFHGIIGGRSS